MKKETEVLSEFRKILPEAAALNKKVSRIDWANLPMSSLITDIELMNGELNRIVANGESQIAGTRAFAEHLMTEKEIAYRSQGTVQRVNDRLAANRGLPGAMRQVMTAIKNAL